VRQKLLPGLPGSTTRRRTNRRHRRREALDRRGRGFAIGGHCQVLLVLRLCDAGGRVPDIAGPQRGINSGGRQPSGWRDLTGDRSHVRPSSPIDASSATARRAPDLRRKNRIAPGYEWTRRSSGSSRIDQSRVVSAVGNRRAFRVARSPLDMFRSYMAVYAPRAGLLPFQPTLIGHLKRHWNAQNRTPDRAGRPDDRKRRRPRAADCEAMAEDASPEIDGGLKMNWCRARAFGACHAALEGCWRTVLYVDDFRTRPRLL